ncbi:MAG: hypothetical protein HZA61_01790 [Candidatus Eisenbacteria bacterium]|uniref:Uncharacterized protein n=1 Tax=Eiseniibacteriota bacterium TaxID=2212470 RepID=A0A933S924_UNCEI|nr:hypothetical protein [Candidatus Eisenbacteria bacterium]
MIARAVLLDAYEALGPHRENTVLIGAQAVYLHTGEGELQVTPFTEDADLALDPRSIGNDPRIEQCMLAAGFVLGPNPGNWRGPHDTHVDLMVPATLGGAPGRRGARMPPHATNAARQASGIEACIVDVVTLRLSALDPADGRAFEVRVAGPAALLVAKAHKLGERVTQGPSRVEPKDALDVFRLLMAVGPEPLAARLRVLLDHPVTGDATRRALAYLSGLFATAHGEGPTLVAQALAETDDPEAAREASWQLMQALLQLMRATD